MIGPNLAEDVAQLQKCEAEESQIQLGKTKYIAYSAIAIAMS